MSTHINSLLLVAFLTACGGAVPTQSSSTMTTTTSDLASLCAIDCLQRVTAEPGARVDCATIAHDLELVFQGYEAQGIATRAQVCQVLQSVELHIHSEESSFTVNGQQAGGVYWAGSKVIEQPQNLQGLAHETVHAYEWATGIEQPNDPNYAQNAHYQWCTPGTAKANYCNLFAWYTSRECSLNPDDNVGKNCPSP